MKMVISLSGGLDSAVLLGRMKNIGYDVHCVTFDYGSKHGHYEIDAARKLAAWYSIPWQVIDVRGVFSGFASALLKTDERMIPEGHYEDSSMSQTVVPGRNMIFASILAGLAQSIGYDSVGLGIHAGDHAIYPDCRPAFYAGMGAAVSAATEQNIELYAPFLDMTKGEIVAEGGRYKVPFRLTRTCYKDQPLPCGLCGSCTERLEAFAFAGLVDPVEYAK